MEILKSASKLVFLLLTITACIGLFMNKISSDDFMILAMSASTFYFSHKGDNLPYAGK